MCDTNWCTFCDCAINPVSNLIYCSEDCFKRDALLHDPLYKVYIEQQQRSYLSPNTIYNSVPEYTQQSRRGSSSNSSVCSEDLAVMHMDMIPCTPPSKPTPRLSTSISPASSHNTILRTPPFSHNLPVVEKITETVVLLSNTAPQPKL